VGDDRPGLLVALRNWLQIRLLRVPGLTVLLRRMTLLSIPLLSAMLLIASLLVRVAVRLVALLVASLLIRIAL
jgi:Flp pilus assembly protein TadB